MSSAALALALTDCLEFFIAITAAMKKVLSPISETRIMPQDFKKPAARPPARRLVMLQSFELAGNLRPVLQQRQACCACCALCNATRPLRNQTSKQNTNDAENKRRDSVSAGYKKSRGQYIAAIPEKCLQTCRRNERATYAA